MARDGYPSLTLGGLSPTAYWDFYSSADTAGQGRSHTPVAWEHLTGVELDTGSTPTCVTPAMYYARSSNLTSELSKQAANLYTSNSATWFIQFRTDGAAIESAYLASDCVLQKGTPGGPGNSRYGFVISYSATTIVTTLRAGSDYEAAVASSIISGGTTDKTFAVMLSFNTSSFRMSANGGNSGETTTPGAGTFTITNNEPLVLGHYWDYYWESLKGWVMRVATWQDYVATASEMNALTAKFANPCYVPQDVLGAPGAWAFAAGVGAINQPSVTVPFIGKKLYIFGGGLV